MQRKSALRRQRSRVRIAPGAPLIPSYPALFRFGLSSDHAASCENEPGNPDRFRTITVQHESCGNGLIAPTSDGEGA